MLTEILSNSVQTLLDLDGNRAYLGPSKLHVYDDTDNTIIEANLTTNYSDLGELNVDKLLNFIEVDYQGNIEIDVYYDYVIQFTLTTDNSINRTSQYLYIPLIKRGPFQKLRLVIRTNTANTILYSVDIDFSPLKRRK